MIKNINPKFYFLYHFIKFKIFSIIPYIFLTYMAFYWFDDQLIAPFKYLRKFISIFFINIQSDVYNTFFGCLIVFSYPLLAWILYLFLKKWAYKRTTFSLDDTGITYTINFIIYSQKHVNYSDIKEINLDQGPLQRLFKLATIKITTHATTANAGIELYNLKPYHEVYEFLMSKKNSK